jgi:hypothetical protein
MHLEETDSVSSKDGTTTPTALAVRGTVSSPVVAKQTVHTHCHGFMLFVRNRQVVFPGGQRPQHIVTYTGENMQETP